MRPITGRVEGVATTRVDVIVERIENGSVLLRAGNGRPQWVSRGDSLNLELKVPFDTEQPESSSVRARGEGSG